MHLLSDEFLLEAFHRAVEQQLDPLFIELLQDEMLKRGLSLDILKVS